LSYRGITTSILNKKKSNDKPQFVKTATKSQGGYGAVAYFRKRMREGAIPSREQGDGDPSIGSESELELSGREDWSAEWIKKNRNEFGIVFGGLP
jgi:surface antigen